MLDINSLCPMMKHGKEFKLKPTSTGAEYINWYDAQKKLKSKKKVKPVVQKAVQKIKLKSDEPATQKQIDYIYDLIKKSSRIYDYNFERDKYQLTVSVAMKFITALKMDRDFKVSENKVG